MKCKICNKEFKSGNHIVIKHKMSVSDYYVKYILKQNEYPKCICGKTLKFKTLNIGFTKTCGNNKCKQYIKKQTCLEKYGVDNPAKSEKIKEKVKHNNIKKYGKPSYTQTDVFKLKAQQTCLEKYGQKFYQNTKQYKEQIKQTCLKKYGVSNVSKDNNIKNKISNNVKLSKTEKVKEKTKQTCLKKYGVENYSQTDEFKIKRKKTCLKKYGVEHHLQIVSILKKSYETKKKNKSYGKSKIEDEVFFYIKENIDENVKRQVFVKKWNIDFYLPKYDLYVQFDGDYWHGYTKTKEKLSQTQQGKHIIKMMKHDKEQNIKIPNLIRIRESEWKKNKNIINEKIKTNHTCKICNTKFNSGNHIIIKHKMSVSDYYVKYIMKQDEYPKCICGKPLKFKTLNFGFLKTCGNKECFVNIREKTCKSKYGGIAPACNEKVIEKMKKTQTELYGDWFVKSDISINYNKEQEYKKFYDSLLDNRLHGMIIPMFSLKDYMGVKTEYEWMCKKCNNVFKHHIDKGIVPKCPICFPTNKISKEEIEIQNWLKENNINIITNDKSIINPYEIDIYLPEQKVAIEYDGIYWHSEKNGKNKKYHLNKTELCNKKGILLLHVFDNEWKYKKNIVKSIIMNKLGKTENRIFARKCKIVELNVKEKNMFLENNHIQGKDISKIKIGLLYDNKIVAILTLGKARFNKNYEWEIIRYANKLNTTVVGGFSKLFKYFIRNYNPKSVITYADRRYSEGNLYQKNEFTFLHNSSPNYFYFKNNNVLYSRNQFQKHLLPNKLEMFDKNKTEWENMMYNGYDRIWDCGNKVFGRKINDKFI